MLLAFSRKQALSPRAVDLPELLGGMDQLLHRALGATIEIRTHAASDLWPCEVDPAHLESAVLNLAINARDAMPLGGTLIMETKNVRLDTDADIGSGLRAGDYVRLSVIDTGEGIPPELLEQVVDPFFTTKNVGHGSGLGLSMVFGFVTQSGGSLTLDSVVGAGTAVRLYLPRALPGHATARGDVPSAQLSSSEAGAPPA